MNLKFLTIPLMLFSSILKCQSHHYDNAEEILLKMTQGYVDALQKGDTSWLRNNFSDKYTYISPIGMVVNKTDAINLLNSGAIKLESTTLEEEFAHIYGDAGIVTELTTIKGHIGNMDISGKYRYLYVFIKQNGRWQIVAEQGTAVR